MLHKILHWILSFMSHHSEDYFNTNYALKFPTIKLALGLSGQFFFWDHHLISICYVTFWHQPNMILYDFNGILCIAYWVLLWENNKEGVTPPPPVRRIWTCVIFYIWDMLEAKTYGNNSCTYDKKKGVHAGMCLALPAELGREMSNVFVACDVSWRAEGNSFQSFFKSLE